MPLSGSRIKFRDGVSIEGVCLVLHNFYLIKLKCIDICVFNRPSIQSLIKFDIVNVTKIIKNSQACVKLQHTHSESSKSGLSELLLNALWVTGIIGLLGAYYTVNNHNFCI